MRFVDDMVVYRIPKRRVIHDYGYTVDNSELARVEDAARMISSQTIDDADYIQSLSRRSDQIAIDKANRLIESQNLQQPPPTTHLRSHRYPISSDVVLTDQVRGLNNRMTRSMSVSNLYEPVTYVTIPGDQYVPHYAPQYVPNYAPQYVPNYAPSPYFYHTPSNVRLIPAPRFVPKRPDLVKQVHAPAHTPAAPVSDYRRRLERKLDTDLLTYEMPTADTYHDIRQHLRGVNDKLLAHRLLLDRYAGIEMGHPEAVESNVESKYSALMARMPTVTRGSYDADFGRSRSVGPEPMDSSMSSRHLQNRVKRLVARARNTPSLY